MGEAQKDLPGDRPRYRRTYSEARRINAQDSSWSNRLRDASRTESTCDLDQPSALTCQNRNPRFRAKSLKNFGAGEGNRTLVFSLEGCCSTIELHPRMERSTITPRGRPQPPCASQIPLFGPRKRPVQAARTESRNLLTSSLSRLESRDIDCAADSTCEEADPVSLAPRCTSEMFEETCMVPCAACCTLREISWVAAPCSSTAAAMVDEISAIRPLVRPISLIAAPEPCVAAWMPVICWPISPVAFAVCSASAFTSEATTANPRPASPARAASMVALS